MQTWQNAYEHLGAAVDALAEHETRRPHVDSDDDTALTRLKLCRDVRERAAALRDHLLRDLHDVAARSPRGSWTVITISDTPTAASCLRTGDGHSPLHEHVINLPEHLCTLLLNQLGARTHRQGIRITDEGLVRLAHAGRAG